jgi:hypothetical protein
MPSQWQRIMAATAENYVMMGTVKLAFASIGVSKQPQALGRSIWPRGALLPDG